MIHILNEELYSFKVLESTPKNLKQIKPAYPALIVATSNKLVRYADSNGRQYRYNPRYDKPINGEAVQNGIGKNELPNLIASTREIATIYTDTFRDNKYLSYPSITYVDDNLRDTNISITCNSTKTDASQTYLIAMPFNGMINPMKKNPNYAIRKALISTSVKAFHFNGRKYRKILYMVIELLSQEREFHEFDMEFESYAIYKNLENNEVTNHEKYTIHIQNSIGDFTSTWDYETLDYPVFINPVAHSTPWEIDMTGRNSSNELTESINDIPKNNSRSLSQENSRLRYSNNANKQNYQNDGHIESDMYVTTNRHGIRKEVPLNHKGSRNREYRDTRPRNYQSSDRLDRMMNDSGIYDHDTKKYDERRSRGNKNNKKQKHKSQFDD